MKLISALPFLLLATVISGCAGSEPVASDHCKDAADLDIGWTSEKVVVLGEYHGSNEVPELFLQVVCDGLERKGSASVGVALELPTRFNEQYFSRVDQPAALKNEIAADEFWNEFGDGRHSGAMLKLVWKLIDLSSLTDGRLRIVAFEQPDLDVSAARGLVELAMQPDVGSVLVLTGNAHARLTPMPGFDGSHLAGNVAEAGVTVWSVSALPASGSAWICMPECGAREIPAGRPVPPDVELSQGSPLGDGAYSATLTVPVLTVSEAVR